MPDKKLTDNEIVKQVRYFADHCCKNSCLGNPSQQFWIDILDYINRQKAEIERLCSVVDKTDAAYFQKVDEVDRAKSEAIKEFAERLKNKLTSCSKTIDGKCEYLICDFEIDNLVKEMVGDAE